jgi:maltooligosyltrehalose trehalohydrolase
MGVRQRRLSAGVELVGDGRADVRVWAPACRTVDFVADAITVPLVGDDGGYFSGSASGVSAGDRYWFLLDGSRRRPDPVSRFQPDGPHGPSMIVDPSRFAWSDGARRGVAREGQVLYEMHVGTFTPEGTWASAMARLDRLAELGVTVVEMMPVADFAGRWGWGYDGVNLYAPTRLYGTPDDLRRFVDRAHALGLGVILDVVYNHLGPDGNYLAEFSKDYFTTRYSNDWGSAINFEGPRPVRDYFVENAAYWIDEYHFDGFRLDATQEVRDASDEHVLAEQASRAREAAGGRSIYVVAENDLQHTKLVRQRAASGYGLDALINDDYHHAALVALTGRRDSYYRSYAGTPQELVSCTKYGYLYQGQWYASRGQPRGDAAFDLPPSAFVHFLENHDQVANPSFGKRVHQLASPGAYRAMTAVTLLGPATPLLFQGQEFGASAPFLFFVDHDERLRADIRSGRRQFMSQFADADQARLPHPDDEAAFRRSVLDWDEYAAHAAHVALHRDLLALRRRDPGVASAARRRVDGAVLGDAAFLIRYDGGGPADRLLVVNLGAGIDLTPMAEPLLAPPPGRQWVVEWTSDAVEYGGPGVSPLVVYPAWRLPAEAALFLRPTPASTSTSDEPVR